MANRDRQDYEERRRMAESYQHGGYVWPHIPGYDGWYGRGAAAYPGAPAIPPAYGMGPPHPGTLSVGAFGLNTYGRYGEPHPGRDPYGAAYAPGGRAPWPHERDWLDKAGDEVSSWFGDDAAGRRRDLDHERSHRGKGPKGYRRTDERIHEDVNDRLTEDHWLDASEIDVQVQNGEITLSGTVDSRRDKRHAEDICDSVSGVQHVQNNLRLASMGPAEAPAAPSDFGNEPRH